MIAPLVFLISMSACGPHAVTRHEAARLVLASPNIRAAVAERGALPFFESAEPYAGGWSFVVKARNPCSGPGPCSNLLGHYSVSRWTAEVIDMDAGDDGKVASDPQLTALRRKVLEARCG